MDTERDRARSLTTQLRRAGVQDLDSSGLARSMYSSDASLYRVPPLMVVRPRDADEVLATLAVCRDAGVPLTPRGAGTSIAGNAVGPGVVLDVRKHLDAVSSVDADSGTAVVQPGVVHAALQRVAARSSLRFGPDPSSHSRCTVGGMVGNNACGSRALGYGRTSDNVVGLDVATVAGERLHLAAGSMTTSSATLDRLRERIGADLATVRTELGRFPRQVSGYALNALLPEHGFDVARALVGSEGTLAVVLGATVRLVRDAPHRALVVLGYPSIAAAADDAPNLLPHLPTACEGLDSRIIDVVRRTRGPQAVPQLPAGDAWLLVEVVGETAAEVAHRAAVLRRSADTAAAEVVSDPAPMAALWRIREDGGGLAALATRRPSHAGWEDAAVPPERLGDYLRDFQHLLTERGLDGVPYGHFGDGCVHVRIDFPLHTRAGPSVLRDFVYDAARLVASYGGSLSGEHGDGRARSELLPLMYSDRVMALFADVKAIFDPDGILNPGVLVSPQRVDTALRSTGQARVQQGLALRLTADGGDLSTAVHRCTGVGKCLADNPAVGAVMCPSYLATGNEKDSTRGRARVLQDMVSGYLEPGAGPSWRADEVAEVLELCLACKGCASDCPTGVDIASYKAEVLHQRFRRRLRPRSHYTLGWLPRWARAASLAPRLANQVMRQSFTVRVMRRGAGIDQRRALPTLADQTFRGWAGARRDVDDGRPVVVLWADTFTDYFSPSVGRAAVAILEEAGYRVEVPADQLCCGLTFISTGQLSAARRILGRTVTALAAYADRGLPVVGLEPSCTAVLRGEASELLDDPRAATLAGKVRTLAELLAETPAWRPPDLRGTRIVAQPHCHHSAVLGWAADERLLRSTGAQLQRVGGCCGLAGNFGMEVGHYDVSVAVAEHDLLPAVRAGEEGTVVLADGFSCRTQLDHLTGVQGRHLAELLHPPERFRFDPTGGAR